MTAATHQHEHPHGHAHPASEENPFAGQGAVMLDIGGDIGALVVQMPVEMLGVEVEIRPLGVGGDDRGHYPHVAVVERPTPRGPVPTLVYGDLTAGAYHLCDKGGGPALATATVRGGEVTELTWPTAGDGTAR